MLPNNNGERGRQKGKANVTCNKCQKKVHYSNKCNEDKPPATSTPRAEPSIENQTATTLLMDGVSNGEFNSNLHFQFFNQEIETVNDEVIMQISSDGQLPKSWILLDNQSTIDVFYNKELLVNIRKHHTKLDIHSCNAGIATTTLIGDLPGYGTVWYNANGIANILSLARVKEHGYQVIYDSSEGNAFHVHKSDGTVRVFKESDKGLYYMDTKLNKTIITLM
jgi:hypothetical protein